MVTVEEAFLDLIKDKDLLDFKNRRVRYSGEISRGGQSPPDRYRFDVIMEENSLGDYFWCSFDQLKRFKIIEHKETTKPDISTNAIPSYC